MTRINTNVGSLIAQKTLTRTSDALQQALTRLSTGLRINSGKDDPAGLIASENLRRDITSANTAISNSLTAGQLIATADSSLGQISGLLNDIRGLAVQAANTGVLSDEQVAANQLQVDASLDAIDRIAKVTTFQGRTLLDGTLDFTKTYTAGGSTVSDLSINQANLGTTGSLDVDVAISAAATQALVTNNSFPTTAVAQATGTVTLAGTGSTLDLTASATGAAADFVGNTTDVVFQRATGAAVASGTFTLSNGAVALTATQGGAADGATGNNLSIVIASSAGATAVTGYNAGTNTLTINVNNGGTATIQDVADAITADGTFTVGTVTTGTNLYAGADDGTYNNVTGAQGANGTTAASYNATTNVLTVNVAANDTVTNVAAAIDADGTFATSNVTNGANVFDQAAVGGDLGTTTDPLSGGVGAGLAADLVVRIGGDKGSEVFNFRQGATISQVVNAINLVSDGTGVQAVNTAGVLNLKSTSYGSNAFVDVEVLSEGTGGTFAGALSATRANGTDVQATVNGATASGNGNTLSVHTSTLDLALTVTPGSSTAVSFTVTGGGAVFQLGPNVVTNQQARIGIGSVNTGRLGGTDGRLYELRSGYGKDLATNPNGATLIVDEAINKVTSLRGRLGAFQRTTIETNVNALKDTVTNLTQAESQIRDADFASETAALTRAQVLTQSGTQVLAIANQQPQNVLALLRNL
jgi:flagellin